MYISRTAASCALRSDSICKLVLLRSRYTVAAASAACRLWSDSVSIEDRHCERADLTSHFCAGFRRNCRLVMLEMEGAAHSRLNGNPAEYLIAELTVI